MPLITCRELGSVGRFGNQLFLYAFAKGYAQRMGCDFQAGPWIGRKIFEGAEKDAYVTAHLPQTELEDRTDKPLCYFEGQKDIDIKVFGQHQRYLDYYTRAQVKEWLKIKPEFDKYKMGGTYSACHLRRGDYVSHPDTSRRYCTVSDASYDRALVQFAIPKPIFFVQEGWLEEPVELVQQGMGWLQDFIVLRDAVNLLRGNSSFSVWASWLGNGKTYAPVVDKLVGLQEVPFVEGNWPCTAGRFPNQSDLHLKE